MFGAAIAATKESKVDPSLPAFSFSQAKISLKPSGFGTGFGSLAGGLNLDQSPKAQEPAVKSSPSKSGSIFEKPSDNPWNTGTSSLFPSSKFGHIALPKPVNDDPVPKPMQVNVKNNPLPSGDGRAKLSPRMKVPSGASKLIGAALAKSRAGLVKKRIPSSSQAQKSSPPVPGDSRAFKIMRIPADLNNEDTLKQSLHSFGSITKILCKKSLNYACVEFQDHDGAVKAKDAVIEGALGKRGMSTTWVRPTSISPKLSTNTIRSLFSKASTLNKPPPKPLNWATNIFGTGSKQAQVAPKSFGEDFTMSRIASNHNINNTTDPSIVASQLHQLIGRKAVGLFDKYQLLEERDKILRKARVKVLDVDRAEVVSGTCPDMCPEKERYQMQVQKRLTPYELDASGNVCDKFVIKDYSRSSADQEEPLPHELRPSTVLQLCMNYLLSLPLPQEESQVSVWYDFLWNRTRGIRKEINQQMLSDSIALSLVEVCARFHAYAAHRLCQKPPGEFDNNMNTENLSKSLQTLRHFYEDLEKKGMVSGNEAEFRALDILLSLNDSNVMTQVLAYPDRVRQSPPVVLALKLFLHKQSNNFAAFFRLIKNKASYLQACVLHRYFDQVRTEALQTMIASYKTNSHIALVDIARILGFDSTYEAVQFCSMHSMSVTDESATYLVLDKTAFIIPDPAIKPRVSQVLVESKWGAASSIGEIVNGGPVPHVILPTPHSSFDVHGVYCNDPVILPYLQANVSVDTSRKMENSAQDIIAQQFAQTFLNKELNELIRSQAQSTCLQNDLLNSVIAQVIASMIRNEAETAFHMEVEANNAIMKEIEGNRVKGIVNGASDSCLEQLIDTVVSSTVNESARRMLITMRLEKRSEEMFAMVGEVADKMVNNLIGCAIKEQCSSSYVERVLYPIKKLARIKKNLHRIWLNHYFQTWRIFAAIRSRKRRILEGFPISTSYAMKLNGIDRKRKLSVSPCEKYKVRQKIRNLSSKLDMQICEGWEWPVIRDHGLNVAKGLMRIRKRLDLENSRHFFERWLWLVRTKRDTRCIMQSFASTPLTQSNQFAPRKTFGMSLTPVDQCSVLDEWIRVVKDRDGSILDDTFNTHSQNVSLHNDSMAQGNFDVAGSSESKNEIVSNIPQIKWRMQELNSAIKAEKLSMQQDEIRWKKLLEH